VGDFVFRINGLDGSVGFLEDGCALLDQWLEVFDESIFVKFVFFGASCFVNMLLTKC